jgi:hypothetical protein
MTVIAKKTWIGVQSRGSAAVRASQMDGGSDCSSSMTADHLVGHAAEVARHAAERRPAPR